MNGEMIAELRRMAEQEGAIDEQVFRRLVLAALAEMQEAWAEHEHPDLMRRDVFGWLAALGAGIAAVWAWMKN